MNERIEILVNDIFKNSDYPDNINNVVRELKKEISIPVFPENNDSLAVTFTSPKTAALFYDRIWSVHNDAPKEIRFGCINDYELNISIPMLIMQSLNKLPNKSDKSNFDMKRAYEKFIDFFMQKAPPNTPFPDSLTRAICNAFQSENQLETIPLFDSNNKFKSEYKIGNYEVIISSLTNLEIISESDLTWEQVLNFRNDKEIRTNYKRFINWCDKSLIGKPQSYIENELFVRHEDYINGLKKHGIKTILGSLSLIFDPKVFGTSMLPFIGSVYSGKPEFGVLLSSSYLIGKVIIEFIKSKVDINLNQNKEYPEIAYVSDLKNRKMTSS